MNNQDIREKYLTKARRVIRFELDHYDGDTRLPAYEIYFDQILIAQASIENVPSTYHTEQYIIDCARVTANEIFYLISTEKEIDVSPLGAKVANLIDKECAPTFFKVLSYIFCKFLKVYKNGSFEKIIKPDFKKIFKTLKEIYNNHYYVEGPKIVADMIYDAEVTKLDSKDALDKIGAYTDFYATENDKQFFNDVKKLVTEKFKQLNGEESSKGLNNALVMLSVVKFYHDKRLEESKYYPFVKSPKRVEEKKEHFYY